MRTGLAWSPDGKWLVVPDRMSPEQPWPPALFLLSVETGEKRRLTETAGTHPALSPDGRTLVFTSRGKGFTLALSEKYQPIGPPKLLTSFWDWSTRCAWTSNGRHVVYPTLSALWRIAASGNGAPQRLAQVEDAGWGTVAALAPQGSRLVYTRRIRDNNLWRVEVPFPGGKAGPPAKLIASTQIDVAPEYSPDGKQIVFTLNRSGGVRIWVCDSDGSNCGQLTEGWGGSPSWSPDGEQIAFDRWVGEQLEIFVVRAEGGAARRLTTDDPSDEVVPSWSRDGRWIYFASNRTGEYQVWKMPAGPPPEPGNAVQVTEGGGISAFESPDGMFLYYAKDAGETSLWKVPTDGGEETQVLGSVQYHSFVVVDEGIYFRKEQRRQGPILFFRFATREVSEIEMFDKPGTAGFTVSPDGRHIVYGQVDQQNDDLMLVENFR